MNHQTKFVPPTVTNSQMNPITDKEFKAVHDLIHQEAGIYLESTKKIMIQSRLSKRIRELGLVNICDYLKYIDGHRNELSCFINALTTNKTELFREIDHFKYLKREYLPELLRDNPRGIKINVWSAACSRGHEVYTLALILQEFIDNNPQFTYHVLGSDIDTSVLETAKRGIFAEDEMNAVPENYLKRNFLRGKKENEGLYKIANRIRDNVEFKQFNLVDSISSIGETFDIIFLRNVMIYFRRDIIEKVTKKLVGNLKEGGLFFTGHSETLSDINVPNLVGIRSAVYKKIK